MKVGQADTVPHDRLAERRADVLALLLTGDHLNDGIQAEAPAEWRLNASAG